MFVLAAILFLTTVCNGQVTIDHPCPNVQAVSNFDLNQYLGKWFDAKHYNGQIGENRICVYSDYSKSANGFSLVTHGVDKSSKAPLSYTAVGSYQKGPSLASFKIQTSQKKIPPTYNVLKTDYKTFSVIFSCKNIANSKSEQWAWILTRSRNPSSDVLAKGQDAFNKLGLSGKLLVPAVQQGCHN